MISTFTHLRKAQMTLWKGKREESRMIHFSGSCHQASVFSPLWPREEPPRPRPCLHASLLPTTEKYSIRDFCQSVLSEGDSENNLASPICVSSLMSGLKDEPVWASSRFGCDGGLPHRQTNIVMEAERALMGWPPPAQKCLYFYPWNHQWKKKNRFVSLLSTDEGLC